MNTIPLHQLPDRAFKHVLQSMEIYDQVVYSLCSKNTKKTIKSLNLKADEINIQLQDWVGMEIRLGKYIQFFCDVWHDKDFPNNQIITHEDIEVYVAKHGEEPIRGKWNFENFGFNEWLHHFCEVLHHPKIDDLFFYGENINDNYIVSIQKVIGGLPIGCLGICSELTNQVAVKVLESFPYHEQLFLAQTSFGIHKLNALLVQNLKKVCIPEAERLKIDQVLLTNSEKIQLNSSRFTEKELNTFLKLWIRGSNPRLKYFYTSGQPQIGSDTFDKNRIMKGIKYKQVPLDSEEVYRDYPNKHFYNETKLAGGSRIRRFNGDTAVVVVTESRFKFIVE